MAEIHVPLCTLCHERPARPTSTGGWQHCSPCNTARMRRRKEEKILRGELPRTKGGPLTLAVAPTPVPDVPLEIRPLSVLQKTTTKDMLARLDDLAVRILGSVDDVTILRSSLKDRMIAAGVVIDKRQLLSGQPTQILSIDERKSLNALVPALLREARRRGIAPIEATAVDITPEPAHALRSLGGAG